MISLKNFFLKKLPRYLIIFMARLGVSCCALIYGYDNIPNYGFLLWLIIFILWVAVLPTIDFINEVEK